MPATVEHDTEFLQLSRGFSDSLSAHPKHVGDELLGHGQLVGWQAIEGQQQPATQLLVYRVMAIAYGGLRHLGDEGLRVTQHEKLQLAVSMEFILSR